MSVIIDVYLLQTKLIIQFTMVFLIIFPKISTNNKTRYKEAPYKKSNLKCGHTFQVLTKRVIRLFFNYV